MLNQSMGGWTGSGSRLSPNLFVYIYDLGRILVPC